MFLLRANITRYFYFFVTKGNLTLVFHMGVNSIRAGKSSPLVPTRCLLFLVTNGNLIFLFFTRSKFNYTSRIVASSSYEMFWRRRDYFDLKEFERLQ